MIEYGIGITGSPDNLNIFIDLDPSDKNHYIPVGSFNINTWDK
jgi:hypothetical protein